MAKENLLREGIHDSIIAVTGNTVVDTLDRSTVPIKTLEFPFQVIANLDKGLKLLSVTVHGREDIGTRLVEICQALLGILNKYPNFTILYLYIQIPKSNELSINKWKRRIESCFWNPFHMRLLLN